MNLSYWEQSKWFTKIDYLIVGSGIVGLNTALTLKEKHPEAKVLIIEKGILPSGASTKNAGFACFGSLSEICSDLLTHSEEEVLELVIKRQEGLSLLRKNLGDKAIDYQEYGSYELFTDKGFYDKTIAKMHHINTMLKPVFKENVFSETKNIFSFEKIHGNYIRNQFEGQIDTGKMMQKLLQLVLSKGVMILNNLKVTAIKKGGNQPEITLENGFTFNAKKALVATNGFASELLNENVVPARAQVLITKPIKGLHIRGTFHFDEGYYYFRNINNRILFGGGRNLDFEAEKTTEMQTTEKIQNQLETYLSEIILPQTNYEVDMRWTGIMGVGNQKKAIVKQVAPNIYCGVRLGGMGVAIGSLVGKELADIAL